MTGRRGFTLVELMLGVVLLLIVSGATYDLLIRTQRTSRAQTERITMQGNLRGGAAILPMELREVGYDLGSRANLDVLAMAPDSIAVRAIRASGVVCNALLNVVVVDTARRYSAYRPPQGGRDSLMLFVERDPNVRTDDVWVRRRITAAGPAVCAASFGNRPGIGLATDLTAAALTDSVTLGSPLRTFEVVVYKLFQDAGEWWLGTYSVTDPADPGIQPLLGPLAPNGFRLEYLDSLGVATGTRANVRSVRITLVARSGMPIHAAGFGPAAMATDSLVTTVTLRNALR